MVKRGTNYLGPPLKVIRLRIVLKVGTSQKYIFGFLKILRSPNNLLEKLHPKNIKFLQKVEGMFIL